MRPGDETQPVYQTHSLKRDKIVEVKPRRYKREQLSKERSKSESSIRESLTESRSEKPEDSSASVINLRSARLVTSSTSKGSTVESVSSKSDDSRKPIMSLTSSSAAKNSSGSCGREILSKYNKVSASELDYPGCRVVNSRGDIITSTTSSLARQRMSNDIYSYKSSHDVASYKDILNSRKDVDDLKSIIKLDQHLNGSLAKSSDSPLFV